MIRKIIKYISLALSVAVVIYIAVTTASICMYSTVDERQSADVAIVLGAGATDDGVSPVFRERINHGILLYNEGYVQALLFTGGVGEGNTHSDAYAAGQYAMAEGIPEVDIYLEETSTITEENLENAKAIMEENGFETAIIISDPLHMKRAMLMAADIGIEAYSSPTETTMYKSLKTKLPFLLREEFFYVGYRIVRRFR